VTLRARLIVGTASLLALAIGLGLLVAYLTVKNELYHQLDASLTARAQPIVATGPTKSLSALGRLRPKAATPALGGANGYVQFVRKDGSIVLPAPEGVKLPTTLARSVAAGTASSGFSEAVVDGTRVRIYTAELRPGIAVQVARPLSEIVQTLSGLRLLFLAISVFAIAGAVVIALALSKALLRPVRRLTEHAERIAATGDLGERTDQTRSDELGRLAVAFNTMLDALAASVTAQRQLVADASHELRTPLTTARTNLEVMELHENMAPSQRRRIVSEAIAELREMTQLIEELVELARGERQPLEKGPTRLDLIADEVIAVAARRSGREFRVELAPTLVEGSPASLSRAITNLVDNALKWGPPGAPVEVAVQKGVVSVRDHGPGITDDDLPHVFDRFYRAAAARTLPGSGLGLAIVRQIAEAHGGTITAEQAVGGGSLFTLRIPPFPAEAATEPPGLSAVTREIRRAGAAR
jgi:two-component system sensor histidine kinase MprB